MVYVKLGVFSFCVLLTISIFYGLYIGPVNFFGYLIYATGWGIAGHGIHVLWGWKINASYAYAIYPLALWMHRIFWKIYISIVDYLPGAKSVQINNLFTRILTFTWFAFFATGLWYVMGRILMWVALENTEVKPEYFQTLSYYIQSNPWMFQIMFGLVIMVSYIIVLWRWRAAVARYDTVESLIK